MRAMNRTALLLAPLLLTGCVTLGRDFDATGLQWLKPGQTHKQEVLEKLGTPFRIGVDAGDPTWSYGYYHYALIGDSDTKDLVIRWNPDGSVKSLTLNTTFPEEKETMEPALKSGESAPASSTTGS